MQLTPFKHENKNYAENLRSTESFRLSERRTQTRSGDFLFCFGMSEAVKAVRGKGERQKTIHSAIMTRFESPFWKLSRGFWVGCHANP